MRIAAEKPDTKKAQKLFSAPSIARRALDFDKTYFER